MRKSLLFPAALTVLLLSGCSAGDLATAAADAAACRAMKSSIQAVITSYEEGVVDSGVLAKIDEIVGDQFRGALSSDLGNDMLELLEEVSESNPAQSAKDKVKSLSASIETRCLDVGVNFNN